MIEGIGGPADYGQTVGSDPAAASASTTPPATTGQGAATVAPATVEEMIAAREPWAQVETVMTEGLLSGLMSSPFAQGVDMSGPGEG